MRTTALLLTAMSDFSGITPDLVADAVERSHRFRFGDIEVAPCFPEDFILTLAERFQRDIVFEARYVEVVGVKFQLRPWFPPRGGHKFWRYYCRVAIDRLPLNAWDWDNVQQVIRQNCKLDLIERQSTTRRNRSALFASLWTWNPDMIPRAADFTVLSRPDCVRSRESLPEGAPVEEGKEGPFFPVLIHLDEVKDYTPLPEGDEGGGWPRINRFRDWRMGIKDGESRGHAAVSSARSDEDRDDGGAHRKCGKRGGVGQRLWQRMRDQAQCRDTTSFNPAPRQRRRHGEAANSAPPAMVVAGTTDRAGSSHSSLARDGSAVNENLQPANEARSQGSEEPEDKQRSDDGAIDAHSLAAPQPEEPHPMPNLHMADFEAPELNDAISSADMHATIQLPDRSDPTLEPLHCQENWALPGNALAQRRSPDHFMGWSSRASDLLSIVSKKGQQSLEEMRSRKALAKANLSGSGLISATTQKVQGLHIDEQQRFIGKIVAILSSSILGAPPAGSASPSRQPKQRPMGAVKASRQSPRLQRLHSNLSSSRHAQAQISVRLGFIKRPEEFSDDTLLAYLQFFRAPMPAENVARLAKIAGLSSPSHLRLPDSELHTVLEELAGRAS
ncbi:hypothetical protein D1007_54320 [Hordeum vulgare]|nr:hypothetical protein D1007_54320 [Hordeum vulgare]